MSTADGQWLLIVHITGENFSNEPGELFEEPPAMMPAVTDSVAPVDSALAQQKNGNIDITSQVCCHNYISFINCCIEVHWAEQTGLSIGASITLCSVAWLYTFSH